MSSTTTIETFEDIDDATFRLILAMQLLDIDQLLLEEQGKRRGGGVSEWEQALVTHRGELRQGLAAIKNSIAKHSVARTIEVDENATTAIVTEEGQVETGAMERRVVGLPDLSQHPTFAAPTPPETPPSSSQDTAMIETPSVLQGMTNSASATAPQAPASSAKRQLETTPEDEMQNAKRIDGGIRKDVDSQYQPSPAENPMSNIFFEMGFARTPKRSSDEAGFDEQSNAKRVDTGKKKGIDVSLKQSGEKDGKGSVTSPPKRRATPKSRRKVGTRRMR
jgi:hypothetical protein